MNRRLPGIGLILCLLFVSAQPLPASADPISWPVQSSVSPRFVDVVSDGVVSVLDCYVSYDEGRSGRPGQAFIMGNSLKLSAAYGYGSSQYLPALFPCTPASTVATPDGTLYASAHRGNSGIADTTVIAEKNGRILWETALVVCSNNPNSRYGQAYAMEMGSDGLLYAVFKPNDGSCANVFAVINPSDGSVLSTTVLSAGTGYQAPKVWTYSDHVIALDRNNHVHYFENGGVKSGEVTLDGEFVWDVWADVSGKLYYRSSGMNCSNHQVRAIDASGGHLFSYNLPGGSGTACSYGAVPSPGGGYGLVTSSQTEARVEMYSPTGVLTALSTQVPSGYKEYFVRADSDTDGSVA